MRCAGTRMPARRAAGRAGSRRGRWSADRRGIPEDGAAEVGGGVTDERDVTGVDEVRYCPHLSTKQGLSLDQLVTSSVASPEAVNVARYTAQRPPW